MPHHTPRPRPRPRRAGVAVLAIALLVGVGGASAGAGRTQATDPPPPPPTIPYDPNVEQTPVDEPAGFVPPLTEGLDQLDVSSAEFDRARDHHDDASEELARVEATIANAARDRAELGRRDDELTRHLTRSRNRVELLTRQVRRLRGEIRELAVASYVSGREFAGPAVVLELDAARHNRLRSQAVMVDTVNSDLTTDLRTSTTKLEAARTDVTLTTATRKGIRVRIREVEKVQRDAGVAKAQAEREVFLAIVEVETWRRLAEVDGTDMTLVALDSYMKAAQITALTEPECGIPWWALAGIGRTESHHGTAGSSEVRADGTLTKPILGIPLNGSGDTAAITLEDGQVDRAQGPMQFITSTWERWAKDGNNDGFADVQNIYDAATAAASYLCASGPMRTDDDLRRGYFSYNHSGPYVEAVLGRAHDYEAAVELPPPD